MSKQLRNPVVADDLRDDVLYGAKGIGQFLGKSERQANHLLERKLIPFGRLGGQIISSKTALRRHFAASLGENE